MLRESRAAFAFGLRPPWWNYSVTADSSWCKIIQCSFYNGRQIRRNRKTKTKQKQNKNKKTLLSGNIQNFFPWTFLLKEGLLFFFPFFFLTSPSFPCFVLLFSRQVLRPGPWDQQWLCTVCHWGCVWFHCHLHMCWRLRHHWLLQHHLSAERHLASTACLYRWLQSLSRSLLLSWWCTSTETIRVIRDGWMVVGEEGDHTYHYTVTTRMTPALRWAAMWAIFMFH